jgi:carbonic anhydrase/acetyltransferase-like protein (isoleucine patch superfamily)
MLSLPRNARRGSCRRQFQHRCRTTIGAGAFVGTNSSLAAPVKIGSGAYIGSGSVITKDVPDDAMAVERSQQTNRGRRDLTGMHVGFGPIGGKNPERQSRHSSDQFDGRDLPAQIYSRSD